ncbi:MULTISPECIES: factor-independent urate hydroxylase [Arthrobacter]|uniref:Uricase n=1 Tax=Arthrobacter cupressi TaxID=1045773 RepID=A0A1G8K7I8_9MICC|nr:MULTISPECIES: urate oxidase [Arthrobacter]NYD77311.1 urate oxidase [Arthrobacter cupressi]SDI39382.1 urate oxidase [Arthrobacter cupressi]
MSSKIVLGKNQYGKAENRVVKITRDTDRHEIEDLNVTSQLRGDFSAAHFEGDNGRVVPTDTQKNTVYAFARDGIGSPEEFLLRLAKHFTSEFDWVTGGRWEAEQYAWERIIANGKEHDHSFVRKGQEVRNAVVVREGDSTYVISGLSDLTVLKSTQSGFEGYPKDKYTTLQETSDRILATAVSARWRYNNDAVAEGRIDYNAAYESVKALLLEGFSEQYSKALQETLYQMAQKVLDAHPEIDELRFSTPNKHHFVVDLSPFGLDNPNEVFFAADRPYGLIEANFERDLISDPGNAWDGIAGFC